MSVAKELAEWLLSPEIYEKNLRMTFGLLFSGVEETDEKLKELLAKARDLFVQKSKDNFPKIVEVYVQEIDSVCTPEEQEVLLAFHKTNPWVAAKMDTLQERTWPRLHQFGEQTAKEVYAEMEPELFPEEDTADEPGTVGQIEELFEKNS